MAPLFPLFLKLEGRRCLVVGAGPVAAQKIPGLIAAGAVVQVVAPDAVEQVRELASRGLLRWHQRKFDPSDIDGSVLVVSATGDRVLNSTVYRLASDRGVLCNAVDEPENCNFYYPSVVRRGDLQIAISTNGHSPALAQRLRRELEQWLPSGYAEWVSWLGRVRARLFRRGTEPQKRMRLLHQLASTESYNRFVARQQKESQG